MCIGLSLCFLSCSIDLYFCFYIHNLLQNLHTLVQSVCTNLHSHQKRIRAPFSPYPYQKLIFVVFLIIAILTDVMWYFIIVFICISLMISDINIYFTTFSMASLKKIFLWKNVLCPFLIGLFVVLILSCMSSLYTLDINLLLDISFAVIFSHSVGCIFIFCRFPSLKKKVFNFTAVPFV